MIRFGIFAVFLLCINISGNHAQDCSALKQGYQNYFQCVLSCYKDVFEIDSITGDLCTTDIQLGGKAPDGFTVQQVEDSIDCIAARCRTAFPPSICEDSTSSGVITIPEVITIPGVITTPSVITTPEVSTNPEVSTTPGEDSSSNSDASSTNVDDSSSNKDGSTLKKDDDGNDDDYYYDCDDDDTYTDSEYKELESSDSSDYYYDFSESTKSKSSASASNSNAAAAAAAAASSNDQGNTPKHPPAPAPVQAPPPNLPGPVPNNGGQSNKAYGNMQFQNNGGQGGYQSGTNIRYIYIPPGSQGKASNQGELNNAMENQGRYNGGEGNQGETMRTYIRYFPVGGNVGETRNVPAYGAVGNNAAGGTGGLASRNTNIMYGNPSRVNGGGNLAAAPANTGTENQRVVYRQNNVGAYAPPGGNSGNIGSGYQRYYGEGGANNAPSSNAFASANARNGGTIYGQRQVPTGGNNGVSWGNMGFRGNNAASAVAVAG